MKLAAAVFTIAAVTFAGTPAGAHYANPGAEYCGFVSYQKATDWGAQVWAANVSCKEARRLAWDFRDRRYGVYKRYRCVSRGRQGGDGSNGMSHTDTRCVRRRSRSAVVTFAFT